MEGAPHADYTVAPGLAPVLKILARQFDGRLVGLGTAVGEKDALCKAVSCQPGGEPCLWLGVEKVGDMPQVTDGDAGNKISVGLVLIVLHGASTAPDQREGITGIGPGYDLVSLFFDIHNVGLLIVFRTPSKVLYPLTIQCHIACNLGLFYGIIKYSG